MKKLLIILMIFILNISLLFIVTCGDGDDDDDDNDSGSPDGYILIDHTCTDLSAIPGYWLTEAKKLAVHYAHTSHGSQIMTGLTTLEVVNATYNVSIFYADATSNPPATLNCDPDTLCIYDGNPPDTYITPDLYWESEGGISTTISVADTGLFDFSMWCHPFSLLIQEETQSR